MKRYHPLNDTLRKQLSYIEPSVIYDVKYYPCAIHTTTSQLINCAYIVEENGYYRQWGVWPEDDQAKYHVQVHEVSSIAESRYRLPLPFAQRIVSAGESRMGYHAFTVCFKNNICQSYESGNAVDFIEYPKGFGKEDIVKVLPNQKSSSEPILRVPTYYWCLYSE